jgi:hypothetical protein
MPENYVLLERTELNASATSVTFANIPQTGYTDLKIVLSARSTATGGQNVNLTFNATTSGYSDKILSGNGSAASSFSSGNTSRGGSCVIPGSDFTASTFGNGEIYIPNYLGSTAKSFSSDSASENNATLSYAQMQATLWTGTAAITTILIDLSGGSFAQYSTFSLYGLAALGTTPAIAPKADGGNVIATDGTYWYHAFLSSGSFVPQTGLSCDVLVVAGGGGGGCDQTAGTSAAGGGAGGILYSTGQSLSTQATITIGAGGAGKANTSAGSGSNGSNSIFAGALTYTGVGGGGGAGFAGAGNVNGLSGGSGGGGVGALGTAGSSTQNSTNGTGYGNAGGVKTINGGAGGGGAGAVGGSNNGGAGLNTWSTWATATTTGVSGFYAGGGGGRDGTAPFTTGTGGSGGGGNWGGANSGVANTGSGGGGGGGEGGASGGAGIVIIRYPIA